MAETARKNAKTARLDAEKIFDAKRENVQALMQGFQLEDKLWLKAKQTMQLLFKDIETTAERKARYVEIHETNRKEALRLERSEMLAPYVDDVAIFPLGEMSDTAWNDLYNGMKSAHDKKIAEEKQAEELRLENERLDKLENERRNEVAPYSQFMTTVCIAKPDIRTLSDADYTDLLNQLKGEKNKYDKEQERIRLNNERLQAEIEAKEKAAEKLRKENELKLKKERDAAAAKQAEIEAAAKKERLIQEEKIRMEKAAKEKAERELQAAKDVETLRLKTEQAAKDKIEKDRIAAEKKAARLPDKKKLQKAIEDIGVELAGIELKTEDANLLLIDINNKLQGFKKWAISKIEGL